MMSSTVSIPTDSRTSPGSTSLVEPATDRWVMTAGTSMSDSTPPSDSASVITLLLPSSSAGAGSAKAARLRDVRRGERAADHGPRATLGGERGRRGDIDD